MSDERVYTYTPIDAAKLDAAIALLCEHGSWVSGCTFRSADTEHLWEAAKWTPTHDVVIRRSLKVTITQHGVFYEIAPPKSSSPWKAPSERPKVAAEPSQIPTALQRAAVRAVALSFAPPGCTASELSLAEDRLLRVAADLDRSPSAPSVQPAGTAPRSC